MSDDQAALEAADNAWQMYDPSTSEVVGAYRAACRAYHRAMIAATPGLCVHEPDGTVRTATVRTAWVRWQVRNHREGTP